MPARSLSLPEIPGRPLPKAAASAHDRRLATATAGGYIARGSASLSTTPQSSIIVAQPVSDEYQDNRYWRVNKRRSFSDRSADRNASALAYFTSAMRHTKNRKRIGEHRGGEARAAADVAGNGHGAAYYRGWSGADSGGAAAPDRGQAGGPDVTGRAGSPVAAPHNAVTPC